MNKYSRNIRVQELNVTKRRKNLETFKFTSFYPYRAFKKIEEVSIENQKLETDVNYFLLNYYKDLERMDNTQGWGFFTHTKSHNFINFVSDFINYDHPEQVEYESEDEY